MTKIKMKKQKNHYYTRIIPFKVGSHRELLRRLIFAIKANRGLLQDRQCPALRSLSLRKYMHCSVGIIAQEIHKHTGKLRAEQPPAPPGGLY